MREKIAKRLIFPIAILLVAQVLVSWESYLSPTAWNVWQVRSKPAWERTAILLEGKDFAGHIRFLLDHIPEDSRLILPPRSIGSPYEHIGFMQYFLIPRDIHNCGPNEVEECVRRVSGETTYIVGLSHFPPPDIAAETKRFIRYEGDYGVYAPK